MKLDLNLDAVRDAAKDFALDVWEDLGRTRLAGVAVGLTLALLVVTALALRPDGGEAGASSTGVIAPAPPEEEDVSFTVPSDEPMQLSDVDLSAPRDPFRSLDGLSGSSDQTLLAAGEEIVDSVMSGSGGSTISTGSDATSLMPLDDLSTTDPATTPTSDEPEGEFGDTHEPDDTAPAPVTDYSYTADVQFGLVDDLERYRSVQRLGLMPSRQMPLIMYLGVSSDHETAVFMVDSRLSQGGEGNCVPRDSLCSFLELKVTSTQDEHHFRDADGNEYLLRLRGLTRTTATSGSLTGRDVSALRGSPPVVDGER
jgi:hypothetical protein